MSELNCLLAPFESAKPSDLVRGALQDRVTTKFLVPRSAILAILQKLPSSYRLLLANQERAAHYRTLHFDTENLTLFHAHRCGRRQRYKIRIRHYDDRKLSVFEVKHRLSELRTVKFSRERVFGNDMLQIDDFEWATKHSGIHADLKPQVWTRFQRAILINTDTTERFTIDCDLSFSGAHNVVHLQNIAIFEIKQPRLNRSTPIYRALSQCGFKPASFSKYCAATIALHPDVRHNRLLPQFRNMERIEHE